MRAPTIAVTGADGFFGWHLRARFLALAPDMVVCGVDRTDFDDEAVLAGKLRHVDAVVHLAGANRGPDDDISSANVVLAARLAGTLEHLGVSPHVIFANSIHAGADTAYGRSKLQAAEVLSDWGRRYGAPVADLRFANLFGECGRPNYNSAVATFCHNLLRGQPSQVNPSGWTELLHVGDACAAVLDALRTRVSGTERIAGQLLAVPEVYERLEALWRGYHLVAVPALRDRLDLQLFNALRTAMYPDVRPLPAHADPRGLFAELSRGYGRTQTSYSTTVPGVTRGDHFHLEKIERFVVVSGSAVIRLRRLLTDKVVSIEVTGTEPVAVDMPPLHTHNITNTGDGELVTVFWANDHFDPERPDTYAEKVEPTPEMAQ